MKLNLSFNKNILIRLSADDLEGKSHCITQFKINFSLITNFVKISISSLFGSNHIEILILFFLNLIF
jgi:Zn-dependent M32 family carboxypeptidase